MKEEKLKKFKKETIKAIKMEEDAGIVITSAGTGMIGTEFELIMMFGNLATKLYENGVKRELLRDIVEASTLNKQEVEEKFHEAMKNIKDMLTNLGEKIGEKKGKKKNDKTI